MAGIATGMARDGLIPYIYSIATFATMRCYEQLRNGAALHGLPVRVIGIGGGFSYGHAGPTHYALEDLAILRTQPSVAVIAPADQSQAREALRSMAGHPGPVYFRVNKNERPDLPGLAGRFARGVPSGSAPASTSCCCQPARSPTTSSRLPSCSRRGAARPRSR